MSQFNTFYIPMTDDGQSQESLNRFLRSHRVLAVHRREFPEGWGFCIEWIEGAGPSAHVAPFSSGGGAFAREKVDYMKVLAPEVFARFSELRKHRREIADADGVKPFVVMTDAQLAEVARLDAPTVADLRKIDGVGDARVEKYGERLLAPPPAEEPAAGTAGGDIPAADASGIEEGALVP